MSHQVKSWYGAGILAATSHPAVEALAQKWLQIRTERDPVLGDFWHEANDALSDWSMLFLKGEDDYVYLHHGRALRDRIGFSMQGRCLSELRTRVRESLVEVYDQCTGAFALGYLQSFADFQQQVVLWGRLCLPLRASPSDPRVLLLVYCHPIDDKLSILKALFEHAHAGVLIAAPIRDEAGGLVDAWIVAHNDAAGRFTGVVDHATASLQLRETELFRRDDLWSHLTTQIDRGTRRARLEDPAHAIALDVEAELVDSYLVLRIAQANGGAEVFLLDRPD